MNAIQLLRADGTPLPAFACGECGHLSYDGRGMAGPEAAQYLQNAPFYQNYAEQCCRPQRCTECGLERPKGDYHPHCTLVRQVRNAEKWHTWDEGVFWLDWGTANGFFPDLGALLDWLRAAITAGERCEGDWPQYVFLAVKRHWARLDASEVLENLCEETVEGSVAQLEGVEQLEAAIAAFNAANAHQVLHWCDYGRVVRVPTREEWEQREANLARSGAGHA